MPTPFWRGYARGTAIAWLIALPPLVGLACVVIIRHHAYPWLIAVYLAAVRVGYMCTSILRAGQ